MAMLNLIFSLLYMCLLIATNSTLDEYAGYRHMISFMGYKDVDVEIEITLVNPNKVDTVAYLSFHSSYLLPTNEVLLKTGQHDSISIPLDKFVVNESCKSTKGIRIGSDLPILVYGSSRSTIRSSTDFFFSIPQKALGKVYSVITGLNRAQLLVVGLHSNTSVNITVQSRYNASYQNTIYQSGQTIEETLNEYETLLVENAGKYPFTDFSGTMIRSSAQVSVFSGNGFFGSSIQVEQLPTVALWGTYHIALPPDENTIYTMTIVAVCNDTHISIECSNHPEMTYTLQTGNFLRFPPSAAVCFILTSEPVEIAIEIDGGGMDATMTILQPIRRIHLGYFVFHLPAFRIDMQYTLVVTAYCNTSLRLDDATLPLFKVATTDGKSSVCTGIQAIDNGTHAISSSDSAAFFISGYLYGRERHQTVAMPLVPYLDGDEKEPTRYCAETGSSAGSIDYQTSEFELPTSVDLGVSTPPSQPRSGGDMTSSVNLRVSQPTPGGNKTSSVNLGISTPTSPPTPGGEKTSLFNVRVFTPTSQPTPGGDKTSSVNLGVFTPTSQPTAGGDKTSSVNLGVSTAASQSTPGGDKTSSVNLGVSTPTSPSTPGGDKTSSVNLGVSTPTSQPTAGGNMTSSVNLRVSTQTSPPTPGGDKTSSGNLGVFTPTSQPSAGGDKTSSVNLRVSTAASQSTAGGNNTTTVSTGLCKCRCSNEHREMNDSITVGKKGLSINKTKTSKYIRSLTSAPDSRPSSKVIGVMALLVIGLVFSTILLLDSGRLLGVFSCSK